MFGFFPLLVWLLFILLFSDVVFNCCFLLLFLVSLFTWLIDIFVNSSLYHSAVFDASLRHDYRLVLTVILFCHVFLRFIEGVCAHNPR